MADLEVEVSRAYVSGFIVGLALLIVGGVAGFQLRQSNVEEQRYQIESMDATPVEFGVLTEVQRAHSKLYTGFREPSFNVRRLVAQSKGTSRVVGITFAPGLEPLLTKPQRPEEYFANVASHSDVVILGKVTTKTSYITEDETFIFTDYEVVITEVLKNNAAGSLSIGETMTVTRPEGKILIDGILVKGENAGYAPLPNSEKNVVLFLQHVPEATTYQATNTTATFELDGLVLRPLTKSKFPPGVLQDAHSFLQTARAVSR